MVQSTNRFFCAMLRTKSAYWRAADGMRLFDPESSTACYTCVLTQRPAGPDGLPADVHNCSPDRACFKADH
jgi:hypothetical protein